MLRTISAALLAALLAVGGSTAAAQERIPFTVRGDATEADRQAASAMVEAGRAQIETFFGRPFAHTPRVTLAANRAEFNAAFPAEWEMSETQCWMVGVGVADFLAVLAPSAWATDACEHDGGNSVEAQEIITHELTHAFHGQYNATGDFTGMDDMGWFVEGLAVLVSGQLETRTTSAADAIAADAAPTSLAETWSGRYRYAVAGSLVRYIDETYGRAAIADLLTATSNAQALARLGVTESELLANWRAWVLAG